MQQSLWEQLLLLHSPAPQLTKFAKKRAINKLGFERSESERNTSVNIVGF